MFSTAVLANDKTIKELDSLWAELANTVANGDLEGYSAGYHPDAILVNGLSNKSYPIAKALAGWKQGFVDVKRLQQSYDLQALWGDCFESGSAIEVRRIFHHRAPSIARIYDPFSMTGMSYSNILNEMGFAGYSPATQFLMTPIFEDLLRDQAIQFNDTVRKSAFSFELINNKLKIFPVPLDELKRC